jgi:hypothetical protein
VKYFTIQQKRWRGESFSTPGISGKASAASFDFQIKTASMQFDLPVAARASTL